MVSQGVMSRCDGSAQRQVSIPLFDWRDHPSVPTCPPRGVAASGGQGWPQATVLHGAQRPWGPFAAMPSCGKVRTAAACYPYGMVISGRRPLPTTTRII